MPVRGLVIGKFLPPHRGHQFLIETALRGCDKLTAVVCRRADDPIPAEVRAGWLRELYPPVDVAVVEDILDDENSRAWAEYTVHCLGFAPERVFTSESYGETYAACLSAIRARSGAAACEHVCVDRDRRVVPVSGSAIRADLWRHAEFLDPLVRSWFVLRVAIVGVESSGTTTLARDLAARYETCWVPEYGRFYYEGRMTSRFAAGWTEAKFVHIATMQARMEDALARVADRVLFCDTDPFATAVWHERYRGTVSPAVDAVGRERAYALTFVTAPDFPFVQDGTRDGEHLREWMHGRFLERLRAIGRPFHVLGGTPEQRVLAAARLVDRASAAACWLRPDERG